MILFGPLVGVLQLLVLQPHVARAGWWVLASTLGWAVYGAFTGTALVWLLRQ